MKIVTYENDKDIGQLIYTELTDDKLLEFFFKKGGEVNITNLNYCMNEYGYHYGNNMKFSQHFVNLETAGLIKPGKGPYYKVTRKARLRRLYDHKGWQFWLIVIAAITSVLSVVLTLALSK